MKYPYTIIGITIASQVSGQVLLLDVVLSVGRSFLLMISVRALSGKHPVDDLLRLDDDFSFALERSPGNPFFDHRFGHREIGVSRVFR